MSQEDIAACTCQPSERSDCVESPAPPDDLKRQVTDFYDRQSSVYDKAHHVDYAGGQYFVQIVAADITKYVSPADRVLEIGCGTGMFTAGFRRASKEVISTDISSGMIDMARNRIPEGNFSVADAENLPFEDNSFDCVVGVNTFSYFQNKHRAVAEITRVLKTPGKLVLYDMNLLNPLWFIYPLFDKRHRLYFRQLSQSNRLWLSHLVRDSRLHLREIREFYWLPFSTPPVMVRLLKPMDGVLNHIPLIRYFGSRIKLVADK